MTLSMLSINPPAAWSIKSHCFCLEGKVWALCIAFWQAAFLAPWNRCSNITVCNRLLDPRSLGADRYRVSFDLLISLKAYDDYTVIWWIWFNNNILPFVWHLVVYKVRMHYFVCSSQQLFMGSSALSAAILTIRRDCDLCPVMASNGQSCH